MRALYCLVLAANPYPEVAVAPCDPSGRLITRPVYKSCGTHVDPDSGLLSPSGSATKEVVEVYFAHSGAGTFNADAGAVVVLDATPRGYQDAMIFAIRCPRGSHVKPALTPDRAREILATLVRGE